VTDIDGLWTAYVNGGKAGTYTRNANAWTQQPQPERILPPLEEAASSPAEATAGAS
jgi:hypothetical protein